MPPSGESYHDAVQKLEKPLARYAKRSFETFSSRFLDGDDLLEFYEREWAGKGRQRLLNRTPLQRERDRILYSDWMRKQTEKYHVLYSGRSRIIRNYTTHTMRMAQVTRAICRGLRLNGEFAEAIALGSKLGAVPFIHTAKSEISKIVQDEIQSLDAAAKQDNQADHARPQQQLGFNFEKDPVPSWIKRIRSTALRQEVLRHIPWAAGDPDGLPYTSGQESYWLLTTNPFTHASERHRFSPETMYGIWRHSRASPKGSGNFRHKIELENATHELSSAHQTYEATVVQYADDITWVIENINDANNARILSSKESLYHTLSQEFRSDSVPDEMKVALSEGDPGALYTYFITDFVTTSDETLVKVEAEDPNRQGLRDGDDEARIGLSADAEHVLNTLINCLNEHAFSEPRVANRNKMLAAIIRVCFELLYKEKSDLLDWRIEQRGRLGRLNPANVRRARQMLTNDVHRLQLSVDCLVDMSDQEIFELVGVHPF